MHERQSVVFEEFGLVAALEWLAERTQDQANVDVVVELEDVDDDPDVLPKRVTRAAFRVAILAVDNAVRHAKPSRIELRPEARGGSLALLIVDDGASADPAGRSSAGRGLMDMRAAAGDVGASFDARLSAEGTTIEFRWPAAAVAENHAEPRAASTDRRNRPHP